MGFVDLPPQVRVECDRCGAEMTLDGWMVAHFSKADAREQIHLYEWWQFDSGFVRCPGCEGARCEVCDTEIEPSVEAEQLRLSGAWDDGAYHPGCAEKMQEMVG